MMISKNLLSLFVFLFALSVNTTAQTEQHKSLLKGDRFYNSGDYQLAEENYRKARESEKEIKSTFNLGNAVYQQERFEEAIDHYTAATQLAPDNTVRSDAYFNLGNSLFKNSNLQESIDAYKEAIQLNPDNQEAKFNLLVAKRTMRDAQQQENQQQQDGEPQEGEPQEGEPQEGEPQEGEPQEGEPQEGEPQEQEPQEEKQDSTNQNSDIQEGGAFDSTRLEKQTLDSLDAMKLLQVIENEEKKVQEKLKKFNSNRKKPEKDW